MMHLPLRMLRKGSANRQITLPLVLGAVFLVAALALCMLFGVFFAGLNTPWSARSDVATVSYSDFQTQVQANNVTWVTLDNPSNQIDAGLRHAISTSSGDRTTSTAVYISTVYPYADQTPLRAQLQAHHVQLLSAPPDSTTSGAPSLLLAGLACGGFALCLLLGGAALFLGILRLMARGKATTSGAGSPAR